MKTTAKEFKLKVTERRTIQQEIYLLEQLIRRGSNTVESDTQLREYQQLITKLDETYFNLLPEVTVDYWIGSRNYQNVVNKIGKKYYYHYSAMTKGNGYSNINEIPEITEEMRNSMIADSYYY